METAQATHDTLKRRRRDRPTSTGKRVTPQPRDLLWFEKLHHHGPLSSTYLHAFSQHICKSDKRARDRLTDLFNEDRTPHGGTYLTRPPQQFRTYDARYQNLVYDLATPAETALKSERLWSDHAQAATGAWTHRYMVSAITSSIELATQDRDDITFISQSDLLARADVALRYPVPFLNTVTNREETRDLMPDALFALKYKTPNGPAYRAYLVEADRATEPSRTRQFSRKSHLRTTLQYRSYIGGKLYKQHLNLKAGIVVLNVSTDNATMRRMMALTEEVTSGKGMSYMLFATCEAFGDYFKPPKVLDHLLTEPWERAGRDPFHIDRP